VEEAQLLATGVNASPGTASGAIVLDADTAEERGSAGQDVILVRPDELAPDDIHGMIHARGLLTGRGGISSSTAVVARGMGKPCVTGCASLSVDLAAGRVTFGSVELAVGDVITVDGGRGRVYGGVVEAGEGGAQFRYWLDGDGVDESLESEHPLSEGDELETSMGWAVVGHIGPPGPDGHRPVSVRVTNPGHD
jgi:phosphohistidine swiveling domain-containing protein